MRRAFALPFLFSPLMISSSLISISLPKQSEVECLASAIFHEARGEPYVGQLAVGHVILNRARKSGSSVCDVIAAPRQFSFYRKGMVLTSSPAFYSLAMKLLVDEMNGWRHDFLKGITHYARVEVQHVWMRAFMVEVVIGEHKFLRER